MKRFALQLLAFNFALSIFSAPIIASAGAVFANDVNILPDTFATKLATELNTIPGLSVNDVRAVFTIDGIEVKASDVKIDTQKVEDFDSNKYPFIGNTVGTLNMRGSVFADNGKIGFVLGTVAPASIRMFDMQTAVEKTLNSFIGSQYIGSVDMKAGMLSAHPVADPTVKASDSIDGGGKGSGASGISGGIVPDCSLTDDVVEDGTHLSFRNPCDFNQLINMVNRFINYLLVYIATPIAAIVFAYAGFLLMFSASNEHNKTHAKSIIRNVLIGYVIALAAWLIIKTLLVALGFTGTAFLG